MGEHMAIEREDSPQMVIMAGPNGSGKSTCAELLLSDQFTFINADVIAQEISGDQSTTADLRAGRILIARMEELQSRRQDFAVETTLSTRKLEERIVKLQELGYETHMLFLWLPSDDLAVQRVAARVRAGGHDVPEETIRRRFQRGLKLFFNNYMGMVDTWRMYDNSRIADPQLIAWGRKQEVVEARKPELYAEIFTRWLEVDFDDQEAVHQRVTEAVRRAIQRNKAIGNPLPEWDGERVKVVAPEDLPSSPESRDSK